MPQIKMKALIFDFDGLILDSETPIFQAWKRLYHEYDQHLALEDWVDIIGVSPDDHHPIQDLHAVVGDRLDREAARKKVSQWEQEGVQQQQVLPGVKDTIAAAEAAGLKLGVASSSSHSWVDGHLERLNLLEHFHAIACSDDVRRSKPDPEVYHLVLQRLGLSPQQAVVLEDSPNGVLAAKRAGLYCVAVPNTMTEHLSFNQDGYQPDLIIESLVDFPLENFLA